MSPAAGVPVDGALIRRLREDRGLWASELAVKVGVSDAHMRHIELGRRAPSPGVAVRIARFLDVPLDSLRLKGE